MPDNSAKRREPVDHRGQRVPNLWKRPKKDGDKREGDTFEVVYRDELGKQRQKTLAARTVQRALVEAEEHRSKVRRGELVSSSRLTLSEVAAEYFERVEAAVTTGERSRRTLDLYRQRFSKHIEPALGRRRVQDIRAEQIGVLYAKQRKDGLAAWTIAGTNTILSALFRFALSRGYIATSPLHRLDKIEKPQQISKREARRLSETEIRALCAAATPGYRAVVTTLAWTGLRVSEALGLRWEDIDLENKEIRVRGQLDENGELKKPKTKAGLRSIPLLPVLEEELRLHRKKQLGRGLSSPEHLVFTTLSGQPVNRHNVRNRGVLAAAKKAGLVLEDGPVITTHDLRRTFISHLIVGIGLDPVRVARIAGHSNVSLTMNVYADEFDKAQHRDDLMARIEQAKFGSV
jgi:integrase